VKRTFVLALACALLAPIVAFAQDAIAGVVDQLCSDKSGLVSTIAWAGGVMGAASLLANFRSRLPAPVVFVLDFVGANWFKWFESAASQAAAQAKKTATAIALLFAIGAALSACSPAQLQATNSEAAGLIATGCLYEPAITGVVASSGNQSAIVTQSFATNFCRSPTISAESAAWLKSTQESAAAQVGVPVVLPGTVAPASPAS
jgi:hypothetical protein